jgi:serine/threonine-protein kinase HipA
MNRCPITYNECGENLYSPEGLKLLSSGLDELKPLQFTQEELRLKAFSGSGEFSLPGSSLKLLAKINLAAKSFEIFAAKGKYILKPQSVLYSGVPENEDLTMKMAKLCGIEVPVHGLIYNYDKSLTYFIRRFDRGPGKTKYQAEDFAQLLGKYSYQKFDSLLEEVAGIIDKYCTFPVLEKIKLLRFALFNYLIGNCGVHLKKYSLIKRHGVIMLSPFYGLVNTVILYDKTGSEISLPLNGKKKDINKNDFFEYFGIEILNLNSKSLLGVLNDFEDSISKWLDLIQKSFLSMHYKEKYIKVLEQRINKFFKQ